MSYDVIIVGGGTAGAVLGGRLSEAPHRSVLLLEAGPDYPDVDRLPEDLRNGNNPVPAMTGPHLWSYPAHANEHQPAPIPLILGKVTGGCSAVNGALFVRGVPEDYDGWAAQGNTEWAFRKVLPYFRKMERDLDFGGEFHGSDGPIPVRRHKLDNLVPAQGAFLEACLAAGFPEAQT